MKRLSTAVVFAAAGYAIAWAARAAPLWAVVAGLAAGAVAYALT